MVWDPWKNYKIFFASLPTDLRKAVTLYKKYNTWEPFILKLEKKGEQHATDICRRIRPIVYKSKKPLYPIYGDPTFPTNTCLRIIDAVVKIIKRFKR